MPDKKRYETEVCEVWVDDNEWIHTCFKEGADVEEKHMKEIDEILLMLCQKQPFLNMVDLRNKHVSFDAAARNHAASAPITQYIIGSAVLYNTLPTRLLVNFYLRFNKPAYPTMAFTDELKASKWLKNKTEQV